MNTLSSVNLATMEATYEGQTFNVTSLYWDRAMRCYCYTTDDPRNPGTTEQQQISKYIRCLPYLGPDVPRDCR